LCRVRKVPNADMADATRKKKSRPKAALKSNPMIVVRRPAKLALTSGDSP
jgi:hypothetical protein